MIEGVWSHQRRLLFLHASEVGKILVDCCACRWSSCRKVIKVSFGERTLAASNSLRVRPTCSKWLLSAYPLTNNQYRVVDKLGPGRSSIVFSFPPSVAAWTFRFLLALFRRSRPARAAGRAREQSAESRRGRAAAAGEPMMELSGWCPTGFGDVCVWQTFIVLHPLQDVFRTVPHWTVANYLFGIN